MSQLSSLSVIFPAYNDAGTIASMVVTAMATARRLAPDYEVVVVNDASRDHTGQVLAELAELYPDRLRVVTHPQNRGYGGAIRSGFANATKEWIFYTDGDAQYDAREIADLAAVVDATTDMVNGYKITRQDPLHRVIVGEIYRVGVKLLFGLGIRDVDCDFRLMHRTIFDHVEFTSTSGTITLELVKKIEAAGFRIKEVPVHHFFRAYGTSQFFNVRRVGRTLVDLTRWWWRLVGEPALHGGGRIPGVTPATTASRAAAAERWATRGTALALGAVGAAAPAPAPPSSPPVASA